ncbi:nitrate reductase [Pollutimonas harenae]|uniref:Molybdopterin-dependent oxidoreductase n=1 Tax=Pollutimonas harenae TaxID=657015 RepID=A0A853GNH2_9BURK|nr:nitrate reductase [Pollutimonas harenae]NYT84568.1 molybdopterin-dependent oxidoreductase [Pollutimonas harenae]TEA73039.1 nitrate reductase [Pollutimonas harenae]
MNTPAAQPIRETASICCYCGTGCGLRIRSQGQQVLEVIGDTEHPSNRGALCSKGHQLAATVRHDHSRILQAQWRREKNIPRHNIPLEDACDIAASKLAETMVMHGPDAIGFYLSGQLLTEDYAVFNKLARALVGTNNIDTNSRLCMSSAVSGYIKTLGADAPPACYDDLELANTVMIAGSNLAYAHPVLFQRLARAKEQRPAMKVIVIDPRRTDTCDIADLHLAITPGSDVALFHAMLNVMVWEDLIDRDYIAHHTEGFARLKQRIHEFTPQAAQEVCGVPAADIIQCARWFGQAGAALSLYTMGLNQSSSGTAKNAALIHLHLATGQIGKPGAGPFSLTGQPNAMGGREAGGMATLLPGHRSPDNAAHRAEVAKLWQVDALPATPGHTALDMFDAVLRGEIKVLWIAATNPAQSLPDQSRVRAALQKAELVIVQEAFANTETLAFADLVLPAATWPEKEGTVTNSERRISRVRAAIAPPGDAQADWRLVCTIARKLAARIAPEKVRLFNYGDEADIFAEHARSTAGRDLDYSALDYAALQAYGPQQWPYNAATQSPQRLYVNAMFPTDSGRARFMDVGYVPVAEKNSAAYPLRLTTGRMRDQWHTMSRSGLVPALNRHVEEPFVYLHPGDMRRQNIVDDTLVRIKTKRGALILPAMGDDGLKPGHAFLHMHWGSAYVAGDGINVLANSARDPVSHQPELKHSAAGLETFKYRWSACAWVRGDPADLRPRLTHWLKHFPYAVLVSSALGGHSVRLRLAGADAISATQLERLAADLGLAEAELSFDDPARGVMRRIRRHAGQLDAWLLAGDTRAANALLQWADTGEAPKHVSQLLMGRNVAVSRNHIICTCAGVSDAQLNTAISSGQDLEALKTSLKCGVTCGSCLPQIKRMLERVHTRSQ